MNLTNLKILLASKGCQKIYIKKLSPNDNSKNQVYLGKGFEILNILPIKDISNDPAGDWNLERFKASINFSWIDTYGNIYPAPKSQLILYPKYPEVRFSGFLIKCENPPSELMTQRLANRLLFFSVTRDGEILGYVTPPNSDLAVEIENLLLTEEHGVFKIIELPEVQNNREKLLAELLRIHNLNWIDSKRLDKHRNILPCLSSNCGGYTLEAELGITPNGYSEPDYLGWEVKQFGVSNFSKPDAAVITLMTPEPNSGYYRDEGTEAFIRKYGYEDLAGRTDRMNFGGIHKYGVKHARTKLRLELIGFDSVIERIRNTDGRIALIDENNVEAAAWNFSSLLLHWNRKHNQACYIPSISDKSDKRMYKYGSEIRLGTGTDFHMFLSQMSKGNIYYDPGIKMENLSTVPKIKKRSQFRLQAKNLSNLYKDYQHVNLTA